MATDEIMWWRDVDGKRHIKVRLTFTEADIIGADLDSWELAVVEQGDKDDAAFSERLEALAVLAQAKAEALTGAR